MSGEPQLKPVFLLGAGRSGTKFLRDMIGTSEDVSTIPYDVGYIWRYGNDECTHDELVPEMLNNSIEQYIKKTLPKLVINPDALDTKSTIFIEKSVPNTLRPAFVHSIYPEAKFIHLIRDGRAVTESALRLWKTPPPKGYLLKKLKYFPVENYRYAIRYIVSRLLKSIIPNSKQQVWGPRYIGINEDIKTLPLEIVCARQWRKCVEVSLSQLGELNQENIIEVRYEDLMKDSHEIEKICDFLGLNDKQLVVENFERIVNRSHTNKWKTSFSYEQLGAINKEIGSLNEKLGYID